MRVCGREWGHAQTLVTSSCQEVINPGRCWVLGGDCSLPADVDSAAPAAAQRPCSAAAAWGESAKLCAVLVIHLVSSIWCCVP